MFWKFFAMFHEISNARPEAAWFRGVSEFIRLQRLDWRSRQHHGHKHLVVEHKGMGTVLVRLCISDCSVARCTAPGNGAPCPFVPAPVTGLRFRCLHAGGYLHAEKGE